MRIHDHGGTVRTDFSGAPPNADGPAAALLPNLHFSTAGLPQQFQFEAWHERLSAWMEVVPVTPPADGFIADQRTWQIGPIALTLSASEHGSINHRDARRARRDQFDHWVVTFMRSGEFRCQVGGRDLVIDQENLALYGMQMSNHAERGKAEWLMVFIARDALPEIAPAFDSLLGGTLDTALGGLLRGHLDTLARQLPRLRQDEAPYVANATLAVLRAAITGSADHREAARPQLQAALRGRVMALVRQNIGSARLDPARLCRMAGVSRSHLYRIFEPEGGVARAIARERLHAARRALADPADRRSIAAIAEGLGMPDPSGFSRAFRQEYGTTPREFREAALALGGALPASAAPIGEARHLGEVFRHLRR